MRSSEGECHHRREGRPRGREVVQTKLTPILYALVCSGKQGPAFPGFPGGLDGKKNLSAMQETWVQCLRQEDPLEEGKATHSSILDWEIP